VIPIYINLVLLLHEAENFLHAVEEMRDLENSPTARVDAPREPHFPIGNLINSIYINPST
jgi:hypothetical protein